VRRFVIVQPIFYGADNTMLLEGLDALQGRGRGVAVIEPCSLSLRELVALRERGVRGLRINLQPDRRQELAARAFRRNPIDCTRSGLAHRGDRAVESARAGKRAARGRQGADRARSLRALYRLCAQSRDTGYAPNRGEGRQLIALLGKPHVWIKLSAPYRSSYDSLATQPDPIWLAEILKAVPGRCVWGSDWPHTPPHEGQGDSNKPLPYRSVRYTDVFDDFCVAVRSPELCERILTDNPAKLYGF
jgi:predicted TIM-barrel fold metal-dependent hydrolase